LPSNNDTGSAEAETSRENRASRGSVRMGLERVGRIKRGLPPDACAKFLIEGGLPLVTAVAVFHA